MRLIPTRLALAVTCAAMTMLCLSTVASLAATPTQLKLTWTPKQTAYLRGTKLTLIATLTAKGTNAPIANQQISFRTKCDQVSSHLIANPHGATDAKGVVTQGFTVPVDANRDNNYVWAVFKADSAAGLGGCSSEPVRIPIGMPR